MAKTALPRWIDFSGGQQGLVRLDAPYLIESAPEMDPKEFPKAIMHAVRHGSDNDFVEVVGANREHLETQMLYGTPLHLAADFGRLTVVKKLISLGANVNAFGGTRDGTPLLLAASNGHHEIVEILLANGAIVDCDRTELSPLISAITSRHPEVVRVLLQKADPHRIYHHDSGEKSNAFLFATEYGHPEILQMLRTAGCELPDNREHYASISDVREQLFATLREEYGEIDPLALQAILPNDDSNISIHWIRHNETLDCQTLFTVGLSDHRMTTTEEAEGYEFAELVIHLPSDWPISHDLQQSGDSLWPAQWLRQLASYPIQSGTSLGGHTTVISNEEPPEPLAPNTKFTCFLLAANLAPWAPISLSIEKQVHLYTVLPIYTEERDLERSRGAAELLKRFHAHDISVVTQEQRTNVGKLR